jgi:dihydrodipicolinate synthase/N-acetylneuraminate lyase
LERKEGVISVIAGVAERGKVRYRDLQCLQQSRQRVQRLMSVGSSGDTCLLSSAEEVELECKYIDV